MREPKCFLIVIIILINFTFVTSSRALQEAENCSIKPIVQLELSSSAGVLVYSLSDGSQTEFRSLPVELAPSMNQVSTALLSPNGLFFLSSRSPNPNENIREVVVFNHNGQVLYQGAQASGEQRLFWLGNELVISLVNSRVARDTSLRSYFQTTIYVIDPFEQTYTSFVPEYDSFFYVGNDPINGFELTYDGRFLVYPSRGAFDFVSQQVRGLENYEYGVPSSSSYNFLVFDYISRNYLPEDSNNNRALPVQIYDLNSDTITQVASLSVDRPVYAGTLDNSWSPDETLWAFTLDFGREAVSRSISLLNLISGRVLSTCLELGFEISSSSNDDESYIDIIYDADFSWSRDSRYLALQALPKGTDFDETFGVYIYDTQTGEIYDVYQGHSNLIGWMTNPSS